MRGATAAFEQEESQATSPRNLPHILEAPLHGFPFTSPTPRELGGFFNNGFITDRYAGTVSVPQFLLSQRQGMVIAQTDVAENWK